MRRVSFLTGALVLAAWVAPLRAQGTGAVRGRVTDVGTQQPLAGASVFMGLRGAITTPDGRFIITGLPVGTDTLRARMIGYGLAKQVVTISANDTATVDFSLSVVAAQLSQMVVVGYGQLRAGDISGTVTQVNADQFNKGRIISPEQLIQSKVPGVEVVDNNEPGGGMALRIRGPTSVTASSDPLIIVDGVPLGAGSGGGISAGRDPLNFINPEDIESITVLRDASAAAIYGTNAANGVVIIKTKTGGKGSHLVYSTNMTAEQVTRLPDMLSASQFKTAVTQYAPQNVGQLGSSSTDWFNLVDRTGYGQEHNITVSGTGGNNTYRLSFGYGNQDGIIRGTTQQRLSLGLNTTQSFFDDRLNVRTSLIGGRTLDDFTPGGVLSNAAQMGPTQPVYNDTTTTGFYNWPGNTLQSADNPMEILALASAQGTTYRSLGSLQTDYDLPWVRNLKASVNLAYDVASVTNETFNPSVLHGELKSGQKGYDFRSDGSQLNTDLDMYLNYQTPLQYLPGKVDLTGGYSWSKSHGEFPSSTFTGLSTDLLRTNGVPNAANVSNFLDVEESKLISFFGRANYNLDDKYLAAVSVRRDGSSRFGPDNAWAVFPAFSAAWRISQEPFMQRFHSLSDLKIRASWAKTGNQAFSNYQAYTSYLAGNTQAQVQFGNQFVSTIRPGAVDRNIKWEGTNAYNFGFDHGWFDQRITGTVDWYVKKTDNMIFTVPVAAGTNFSNFVTTNIGSMKNSGLELALSAQALEGGGTGWHGVTWQTDFAISHNKNELTAINPTAGPGQKILVGGVSGGVGTFIEVLEPGVPVSSFYVCTQADSAGKPWENHYVGPDSVVTGCLTSNRKAFHDPAPKWIIGHTSYLTYKKFDMSFTLRAWLGNWVYNNVASNLGTYQELNRASPYNLNASVLKTQFQTPQYLSSYYVEDASFLRLDNVTLGYNFKAMGEQMRVSGTVQNLFTITGYSGVDPTAGLNGIDNNIYPRSRIFTAGLNVQF